MSALFEGRRAAIAEALGAAGAPVQAVTATEWRLPADSDDGAITARWDEPWLRFETAANGAIPDPESTDPTGALWELLEGQAALPATCRYALGRDRALRVRAEMPFEAALDPPAWCEQIVRGLEAARHRKPGPSPEADFELAPAGPAVAARCAEIGWEVHERPDGRLVGSLPGVEPPRSAELVAGPEADARLSVELTTWTELGPASRDALAGLLLRLSRAVRFTRPVIRHRDGETALRLETRLPDVTAAELRHAIAAVAAAADACAREVEVLRDERIAAEYLAVRGETP